jgi:hypothetical protein
MKARMEPGKKVPALLAAVKKTFAKSVNFC